MPWHELHCSAPRCAHADCSSPWYSYAVRRAVPSGQKRVANSASPFCSVSRERGVLYAESASPGTKRSPRRCTRSMSGAMRCPWHRPQISALRSGDRRDGFAIVGSASAPRCKVKRRSGSRLFSAWRAPGPWQASHAMPSSATSVSERAARWIEPRARRDVVAVDAVVVPARDVAIVVGSLDARAFEQRIGIGRQERAVHVDEALLFDAPRDRQSVVHVGVAREVLLIAPRAHGALDDRAPPFAAAAAAPLHHVAAAFVAAQHRLRTAVLEAPAVECAEHAVRAAPPASWCDETCGASCRAGRGGNSGIRSSRRSSSPRTKAGGRGRLRCVPRPARTPHRARAKQQRRGAVRGRPCARRRFYCRTS